MALPGSQSLLPLLVAPPPKCAFSSRQAPHAAVVPSMRTSHMSAHASALASLQMSPAPSMGGCLIVHREAHRGSDETPPPPPQEKTAGTSTAANQGIRREVMEWPFNPKGRGVKRPIGPDLASLGSNRLLPAPET